MPPNTVGSHTDHDRFQREEVTARSLRDRFKSIGPAIEQLSARAEGCSDALLRNGNKSFSRTDFGTEAKERTYIRRALQAPGTPRGAGMKDSELALLSQEAAKDLVSLILHLPDPREQASVLQNLAHTVQGALMQHAVETVDRAKAEQNAVDDEDMPGYALVDPEAAASDMIAVEQRLSCGAATKLLHDALRLRTRLPRVWNLITDGDLPKWVGDIIARDTEHVTDPAVLAQIEAAILNTMAHKGGTARWNNFLTRSLRKFVAELDPEALTRKTKEDERHRDVSVRDDQPGMSALSATLPVLDARAVMAAVDAVAKAWETCPDETRTLNERRADALVHLVTGIDKSPPGWVDPPEDSASEDASGEPPQPAITVQPRVTLIGDGAAMSDLSRVWVGNSTIARDKLNEFLEQCGKARIESVPMESRECDTSPADILAWIDAIKDRLGSETTYQPRAALRRAVIERDGTCRHPGCTARAERCDLDHVIPFNHANPLKGGLTREDNLICLCRKHHLIKTHGVAKYMLQPDGRLTVQIGDSCVGESYPTGPRGMLRAENDMQYATPAGEYAGLLQQICAAAAELEAELERITAAADGSNAGGSTNGQASAASNDFRPRATAATRRHQQTKRHRERTARDIAERGMEAVRGPIDGGFSARVRSEGPLSIPRDPSPLPEVDQAQREDEEPQF